MESHHVSTVSDTETHNINSMLVAYMREKMVEWFNMELKKADFGVT